MWLLPLRAQDWKVYPHTPEGSLVSFPKDEGWHPAEPIEWWYVAGHLEGLDSGIPYSFMLTYFYYPVDTFGFSYDGFRILNLARDDTGEFHTETMPVISYINLDTNALYIDAHLFNGVQEYWYTDEETDGALIPFEYELSAMAGEDSLLLSLSSQKRPLIPGGDGLFNQGASSYTYYYSLTDIKVDGSISFDGVSEAVTGTAWIDRQYGSFNPHTEEDYEWLFLQLSNGMDLNIWNLFTPDNLLPDDPAYRHLSAYVDENTQYTTDDFILERLAWARMPGTGNCYAQSWKLQSDAYQLDLTIQTLHHNSEVQLPFNFFEGSVIASGRINNFPVTGTGFAELLKTYEIPEPEIVRPGNRWNENLPVQWKINNPDDGRPLLFNLAYSIDHGYSWLPITEGLTDTLYYWNDPPFVNGDSCLFRVGAYTADSTLTGAYEASIYTHFDDQYTQVIQPAEPSLRIYPNPAGQTLWIERGELSLAKGNALIYQIYDSTGRIIIQGKLDENNIDVSSLTDGFYLLVLQGQSESQTFTFQKNN